MHIQNYILLIEAGLLFALAFYVLLRNPKEKVPQAFFVMTFGAGVWVLSNSIDYIFDITLFTRFTYLGAVLIAVGYMYLSLYFPFQYIVTKKWMHYLIIIPGLLITLSLFYGKLFFRDITFETNFSRVESGIAFHVFNIYFLLLWSIAIINFFYKYRKANGLHYWQLNKLFWAIGISFIAGVTTNLILPWLGIWHLGWIGPMFSIIFFGFLSYILFKKKIARKP